MNYLALKHLHITCVVISGSLFALRGWWMLQGSPWLNNAWVRRMPHVVDTLLLGSALWMASIIGQYPFVHGWLTAKVLALLVYIVLGSVALKRGKSMELRAGALVAALLVFGYIVRVALTKLPLPF
ncbi:MAG: SirB2 family protein [Burkholderiales bacterium]